MTFDGSSIDGFSRVQESDVLARPDPNTFELLPWADPTAPGPACSATSSTSTAPPSRATPARCCGATSTRPASAGFTFYVAPEMEFFYFATERRRPAPSRSTAAATSTSPPPTWPATLRKRTIQTLEAMGIPVEYSFHEDSPSQHEIDLRHTDALTMADSVMTFRLVVREVAAERGPATPRSCPSRWKACRGRACTPTCACSRATRTPSTTRATRTASPRWPRASSPACSTTPGRSPPSPTRR